MSVCVCNLEPPCVYDGKNKTGTSVDDLLANRNKKFFLLSTALALVSLSLYLNDFNLQKL